jgi:hypothetical protein
MNIEEGLAALVGATITGAALYGGDGVEGDGGRVGVYSLQVRCADGRDPSHPSNFENGHRRSRAKPNTLYI